jgi:serine/threonine-protein kinase
VTAPWTLSPAGARPRPEGALAPGTAVGRYTIERFVGRGGMGEVYAAHDPELARTVAIKMLRATIGSPVKARLRLQREAQAMARLNHPNVVSVFDVGTVGDQIFVAMELVDGVALAEWQQEPRRWRELLDVFVAAGRGLAAAHAVGIVHRDFKPHNVMVAGRRVVVLDFGLALRDEDSGEAAAAAPAAALDLSLTTTGAFVGTPAFMSPEQLDGQPATARSDQWSFCAALYAALFGREPFGGRTIEERRRAIALGPAPPTAPRRVPRRIAALVVRGLAEDPAARHPSMTALLAALERDPWRRARPWLVAGAATALVAGVVVAARPRAPSCASAAAGALAGVWDDGARAALRGAFAAVGKPFAQAAAERTIGHLDRYAADWTTMRVEACAATLERREQSPQLMDLRMACLDRRKSELGALAQALGRDVGADTAARAVDAALQLTQVAACADTTALATRVPLPEAPELRRSALELLEAVERVGALDDLGKYDEARAAWGLLTAAAGHPYPPLRARALGISSWLAMNGPGGSAAATSLLEAALRAAVAARDDDLTGRLWVNVIGNRVEVGKYQEGIDLMLAGDLALARGGCPPASLAELERIAGIALRYLGRIDEAKQRGQRAVEILRGQPGPPPGLVAALVSTAGTYAVSGDGETARRLGEEAVAVAEKLYGPRDRHVAPALGVVAQALIRLHRPGEAIALYRRALGIYEEIYGAENRNAAIDRLNLAEAELFAGDLDAARADYERSVERIAKVMGPDHPALAEALAGLGRTLGRLGRDAEARAALERALAIDVARFGAEHPRVAAIRVALADVAFRARRFDEALAGYEAAVRTRARFPDDDAEAAVAELVGVGRSLRALRRGAEAALALERAVAIADRAKLPAAEARAELARARPGAP